MSTCTICGCKNPEEPKYPCECYNKCLCSTCFKNLFEDRFESVSSDEYYKKIVEEDGTIRFEKTKKHLFTLMNNNFYCRYCFTKWDYQLSNYNYLLESLYSLKKGAYEYLLKKFVFALCKLQKFMDNNPEYDLERYKNFYSDEESDRREIFKEKWHHLTDLWSDEGSVVYELLLSILYSKENELSCPGKVLHAISEKAFEEFEKTYESVKDSIELEEMSFIEF